MKTAARKVPVESMIYVSMSAGNPRGYTTRARFVIAVNKPCTIGRFSRFWNAGAAAVDK